MAFPTTISTTVDLYHGCGGPFASSTNNVYVITRDPGGGSLHAFKATDPSSSWSAAGTDPAMTSGNTIRAMAACQVGDIIHVVTRDAAAANSNQIRYHVFDMSSDSWTTTNTLVKTTYTMAGAVDASRVGINIRADGNKIIHYEGPQVLADIQRSRAYYARHMGVAWSADIALDNGGNNHWFVQESILGSADRIHFILQNQTTTAFYQRTLTSANALESFPAAFDSSTTGEIDAGYTRGVAYSGSAGGTVVRYAYYDNYTPELADIRFTSADAPSPLTQTTDITGTRDPNTGLKRFLNSLAKDGNTVYHTFCDGSGDVYLQSSQDAGAWSTPTLIINAGLQVNKCHPSIYTRNSAKVLALVYDGDFPAQYTEYTVGVALVTGRLSATDSVGTFSASAQVRVTGRLSATDVVGTFSASGNVVPIIFTGRLSATDVVGTLSATGYVKVTARLSATDVTDVLSASGTTTLALAATGRLSATDAIGTFSATGGARVSGYLSATDVVDTFSAGAITIQARIGRLSATGASDIFLANPRQHSELGAPIGTSNSGGGEGAKNPDNVPPPYGLWEVREAYLRSLFGDETAIPALPDDDTEAAWAAHEARQQEIASLNADRATAILQLRFAETTAEMKQHGTHISELNAKIASLTSKQNLNRFMRH